MLITCSSFLPLSSNLWRTTAVVGQLWYYYWTAIKRFSTYCHHNTVQDHIDRIAGVDPCLHRDKRCWHSMRNCGPKRHWDKYNRMSFESTNPLDLKLENKIDISKKKVSTCKGHHYWMESNWNMIFSFRLNDTLKFKSTFYFLVRNHYNHV